MRMKRNKDLYKVTIEIKCFENLKLRAKSPDEALSLAQKYIKENRIEFSLIPEEIEIVDIKKNNKYQQWEDVK